MMESGQPADDDFIKSTHQSLYGNLSAFTVDPITKHCKVSGLDDDMDDDYFPKSWNIELRAKCECLQI